MGLRQLGTLGREEAFPAFLLMQRSDQRQFLLPRDIHAAFVPFLLFVGTSTEI